MPSFFARLNSSARFVLRQTESIMRESDIRVVDADVVFEDVELDRPFMLANASITGFSVARVTLTVENRAGQRSSGTGTSTLSVPWSWPLGEATWQQKDSALRRVVESL